MRPGHTRESGREADPGAQRECRSCWRVAGRPAGWYCCSIRRGRCELWRSTYSQRASRRCRSPVTSIRPRSSRQALTHPVPLENRICVLACGFVVASCGSAVFVDQPVQYGYSGGGRAGDRIDGQRNRCRRAVRSRAVSCPWPMRARTCTSSVGIGLRAGHARFDFIRPAYLLVSAQIYLRCTSAFGVYLRWTLAGLHRRSRWLAA
jgi:hypothetical protein